MTSDLKASCLLVAGWKSLKSQLTIPSGGERETVEGKSDLSQGTTWKVFSRMRRMVCTTRTYQSPQLLWTSYLRWPHIRLTGWSQMMVLPSHIPDNRIFEDGSIKSNIIGVWRGVSTRVEEGNLPCGRATPIMAARLFEGWPARRA
jgi:hypothetical protein